MPPKPKKKKVIWNNNDCRADVCLRPEGTASWVQCDECGGWYHVACLFLEDGELDENKEFYCPNCNPEKEEEFNTVREKLLQMVEELSGRQTEFGGVTIDRDMFKEKKNANPYNYAKDFPPTLRDLGFRVKNTNKTIGDFKWDYKMMCSRLMEELKDDYESRIQMVEWELDEIVEEVMKEEKVEEAHIEVDLDMVKRERMDHDVQECAGGICEHCTAKFNSTQIYSCKREHRVCYNCRAINPGCVCPVCYSKYGDRKRLALDHTSALLYRVANATNFDVSKMGKGKRKRKPGPKCRTQEVEPFITDVWSCNDDNGSASLDQINIEGPIVKAEPEDDYDEPEQVSMATVLSENCLSNQLLTLIDNNVVATRDPDIAEVNQSPHSSPLAQQPTNYNDPGDPQTYTNNLQPKLEPVDQDEQLAGLDQVEVENFALSEQEISDHIQSIREPVPISPVGKKGKKGEELEILQSGPDVMDPFQTLDYMQEDPNQTPVNLGETESPWRKQELTLIKQAKVSTTSMAENWAKYRERAQTSNKLPVSRFQTETGKRVHTLQVSADGAVQIAPAEGSVQPHPLPITTQYTSYQPSSTTTASAKQQYTTLTSDQYTDSPEYHPSGKDSYQSTVQFPPSLEVNHQQKGSSVQYQKVGDNVFRKVSPNKGQCVEQQQVNNRQADLHHVQYTGPSQSLQPVQYTGPSQSVYTGPSQSVQFNDPSQSIHYQNSEPLPPVQYVNSPPSQPMYYNPAETQSQYQTAVQSQPHYYNPAHSQLLQYDSPMPSQTEYYNPLEPEPVQYNSPGQSLPVPVQYSKTNPAKNVLVSPVSNQNISPVPQAIPIGKKQNRNVFAVKSPPPQMPQLQAKLQPTYTIQYTKPNPFADDQLIKPIKRQTSSTALNSPVPSQPIQGQRSSQIQLQKQPQVQVQKRNQISLQKPTQVQIQNPHPIKVQKPSATQYNSSVTIKYNQPDPRANQFQPQPVVGTTSKQFPPLQPQPITGSTTKQFPSSTNQTDHCTTPLAITIKYNQPGSAQTGSITPQTMTRTMLISPPKQQPEIAFTATPITTTPFVIKDDAKKVLEARGCSCESLTPLVREHVYTGPLQFSLLKNYQGTNLEWRPFLALFAATGPQMYQFQLGRAGHIFYIRGVTNFKANMGDRWHIKLTSSDPHQDSSVEVEGVFSMVDEGGQPPNVLPSDIVQGDVRHYIITVSQ